MNFECISPYQLILITVVISFALSEEFRPDELLILGGVLTLIGTALFLIVTHQRFLEARRAQAKNKEDIQGQIKKLQEQCKKLEKK